MRRTIVLLLAAASASVGCLSPRSLAAQQDAHMARALRVLSSTPLIDGHNDLPWAIRGSEVAPHDVEADAHDAVMGSI